MTIARITPCDPEKSTTATAPLLVSVPLLLMLYYFLAKPASADWSPGRNLELMRAEEE